MIGLSGLITPSLDEMVQVAREMQRQNFRVPLLIGGATTSARHTAVRIAPAYHGATVHVLDASRAAEVVTSLLSDRARPDFERANRERQQELRDRHEGGRREDQPPPPGSRRGAGARPADPPGPAHR